jgi:O-acetyl-ADP-ribose deacetylase (regulator of RNase III)
VRAPAAASYDGPMPNGPAEERPRPRIVLVEGDITDQDADAIVNAANTSLRPGGGVDGAIARAAGREAMADRRRVIAERGEPPLPTGTAVATIGGDLRASWIVHTAGPIYGENDRDADLLAACHTSALRVADELGARTVAFPAISCGIYGYPPEEAAPVAIRAVLGAQTDVEEVRFVLFDDTLFDVFDRALTAVQR